MFERTTKSALVALGMLASVGVGSAQTSTNGPELLRLSQEFARQAEVERVLARDWARSLGLPIRRVERDGRVVELVGWMHGRPVYYETLSNLNAANTTNADELWPAGVSTTQARAAANAFNLTGQGITLGIWDAGWTEPTHSQFQLNGASRVVTGDAANRNDNHGTHVGGTMVAGGIAGAAGGNTVRGGSYNATLRTFDWNSDTAEMAADAAANRIRISNHSYGSVVGWSGGSWTGNISISPNEDYRFGFYSFGSRSYDQVAYNAPFYLIVFAAGNDRGQGTPGQTAEIDGGADGFDCLPWGGQTAKNTLVVGAVNAITAAGGYTSPANVVMSGFSSWGPTDDGRIKPDLVANGVGLVSTITGNSTANYSGTSMAAPNTSGSLGLLQELWARTNAQPMRSATLRGLAIHTTNEAGPAEGPDYANGWGLLNVERGAQVIVQDNSAPGTITENVLNQGGTFTTTVFSNGASPLRVTIAWTDPAGTPPAASLNPRTRMLVNDLDLRVSSGGTTFLPYVLNPASPGTAALKADNDRDNVEQVFISAPTAGVYTITVRHKGATLAPSGSQAFSMIVTGQDETNTLASVAVNPTAVVGGSGTAVSGTVTLQRPAGAGGVSVSLSSNSPAATVPATVTVPSGATTANFAITHASVATATDVQIRATGLGGQQNATLRLNPAGVSSVGLNPATVIGGSTSTGTVALNAPAPTGGLSVALSSTSTVASVPASVTVPAGQTTATFAVATSTVTADATATIRASANGSNAEANLTVQPLRVQSLSLNPASVLGGLNTVATVTLNAPAPAATSVSLSRTGTAASVPASVTIPTGSQSATFTVSTVPVDASTSSTIGASLPSGNQTALLAIRTATLSTAVANPTSVFGGTSTVVNLDVSLDGRAGPAGKAITLTSSNGAALPVPTSATVAPGQTTVRVALSSRRVSADTTVTLTASHGGVARTATVRVLRHTFSAFTVSPTTFRGGSTTVVNGTVTLNGPAPVGGIVVTLASSNALVSVPASVTIPAGARSASFRVTHRRPAVNTLVTVNASALGVRRSVNLTIQR